MHRVLMMTPRDLHLSARIFVRRWFGWRYSTAALNHVLIAFYTIVITAVIYFGGQVLAG